MQTQVTFHCFNSTNESNKPVRTISGTLKKFQRNLDTVLASPDIDKFYCSYTEGVRLGPVFLPLTETVSDTVIFIAKQGDESPLERDGVKETDSPYRLSNRVRTRLGNTAHYNGTMDCVINREKKIIVSPVILYNEMFNKDSEAAFMFSFLAGLPALTQTEQERKFDGFFQKKLVPA